jgi:hypothetical protein
METGNVAVSRVRWWLDDSALPQRVWAQLKVLRDGTAELLDVRGMAHRFPSEEDARRWFRSPRGGAFAAC